MNIIQLQNSAVTKLNFLIKNALGENKKILLMLSGGSNLELLDKIDTSIFNSNITVTTIDERFTTDPAKNNMALVKSKKFYTKALQKGVCVIDTEVSNKNLDPKRFAQEINDKLNEWFRINPNHVVIMTIGIGTDGHTSGMKPMDKKRFTKLFKPSDKNKQITYYDATEVDSDNPKRITTNINFFDKVKNISEAVVYAVGKSEVVKKMKANIGELNKTPALILNSLKKVYYFTD